MKASFQLVVLLLIAFCTYETEQNNYGCHRLITDVHLKNLTDLIDSQMKTSCVQSLKYVDERELDNIGCFLSAAYLPLKRILDGIEFKENTPNHLKLRQIKHLHMDLIECIQSPKEVEKCTKTFSLTAEKTLHLIHKYFNEARQYLIKGHSAQDCHSVFQKCSESPGKETPSPGVISAQDCNCPSSSPINIEASTYFVPASEPLPSIADQLDSRKTAVSILQLLRLPDATKKQSGSENSTRSRVPRSTYKGQEITKSMDFKAGTDRMLPPSPSLSVHKQFDSMETRSPFSDSGTGVRQTKSRDLASQHFPLSDLAKFLIEQWFEIREKTVATPGFASDQDITVASSTPSLTLTSSSSMEQVDSSKVPSSGSLHSLGRRDLLSATQDPSRLVVTTEKFSSPKQLFQESYSREKQSDQGRLPQVLQNTQLRERREEGLTKDRESEGSLPGSRFDLNFIPPNADKHLNKKPEARTIPGMSVTYVVVASVLGVLLALGGLLFYLHKTRILGRRRSQQMGNNVERPKDRRSLNPGEGHLELQIQGEL